MKKIAISLAIIGIVTGITLGITGAWWTDQGVSQNQSFVSGNLNLRLSNNGTDWSDNVTQTWNVQNMTPGGTPYVSTLYMKNNGSVNADYLKLTLKNYPDPAGMDKRMRITQLDYAGESLLTGGAGADLDSYVAPTNCTVTTSHINDAIGAANKGDVICVKPGNYTFAWEGSRINVDKGVTIASTDGPGVTTISAGITINANDVTIKGFKIIAAPAPSTVAGLYVPSVSGLRVQYNEIDGQSVAGSRGIEFWSGAAYNDVLVENNVIHDLTTGIYTNPHAGIIDIQYNDIYNTVAGIGGAMGANVRYNAFTSGGEAIGLDDTHMGKGYGGRNLVIEYNNFDSNAAVNNYGSQAQTAENNWWGDFDDPSDQVSGNVDYSPYAGGPFIGYINGTDGPNGNGFADLDDFERSTIVVENPDLLPNSGSYHTLKMGVQLDGPTTGNTFMGGKVGMDMTVNMGQGPAK